MRRLWIGFLAAASAVCFWMLAKTAEHIVLLRPTQALLEQAITQPSFRPAAKLYVSRAEKSDAFALVEFLRAHPGKLTLSQACAALLRGEPLRPAVLKTTEEGGVTLGE